MTTFERRLIIPILNIQLFTILLELLIYINFLRANIFRFQMGKEWVVMAIKYIYEANPNEFIMRRAICMGTTTHQDMYACEQGQAECYSECYSH